jgi:hypothetical protein
VADKHWIRDLLITESTPNDKTGNLPELNLALFNWLRVSGWSWIWECDGQVAGDIPNHVVDGNMEASGVSNWAAVSGGVRAKDTLTKRSGTKALKITSVGVGSGARSDALLTMSASVQYQIAIWASNDSGIAWDVEVDDGGGSFVSAGSIPDNDGVWTRYDFDFITAGSGTSYIRVVDNVGSGHIIYIDGILIWKGHFENNADFPTLSGTDGVITGPDKFKTASSYYLVAGDVGKHVFVWDPVHQKNSGAYLITAVTSGEATLDLRSGSAALVNASGLSYRLVDLKAAAPDALDDGDESFAGFGLESPHTSKWRLFIRQNIVSGTANKHTQIWAAPTDTDFNFSTGNFWASGPSTQHHRCLSYSKIVSPNAPELRHVYRGAYYDQAAPYATRGFFMTDVVQSFVSFANFDPDDGNHAFGLIGYLGADAHHPGIQEFGLFTRFGTHAPANEISFDYSLSRFGSSGTVFNPSNLAQIASLVTLGYGNGAGSASVEEQPNAGPNPWSGKEWIRPLYIIRDITGTEGFPSERNSDCGVYQGRANMPDLSTFEADMRLHFDNGLVWEWSGETLVP